MNHLFRFLLPALALGVLSLPALADSVTYEVTVDTSSQNTNYGYIDLELNAGSLGALPVTANVFDFSGAVLNPADPNNDEIGSVTGSLPNTLSIVGSTSNDYFEGLTFGDSLTFDVTLSGAGVSLAGDAAGTSGTIFQLSFFDPTISFPLFSSDPSGATALIEVAADGAVTTDALPNEGGVNSDASIVATPEPGTLSLFALGGLMALGAFASRKLIA
jgi:hypothetical protein